MHLRDTRDDDLPPLLQLHRAAFGGPTEADLVRAILTDPSAQPVLSLLASGDGRLLGHVLFSRVRCGDPAAKAAILAPLAVHPAAQGKGIGSRLVDAGLQQLAEEGVALAFVLGDPAYYRRFGFTPAAPLGLAAPYALPDAYAEAWRVKELQDGAAARLRGTVTCCDALMQPALWSA